MSSIIYNSSDWNNSYLTEGEALLLFASIGSLNNDFDLLSQELTQSLIPNTTNTYNLGSTSFYYNHAYINTLNVNTLVLTSLSLTNLTVTGTSILSGTNSFNNITLTNAIANISTQSNNPLTISSGSGIMTLTNGGLKTNSNLSVTGNIYVDDIYVYSGSLITLYNNTNVSGNLNVTGSTTLQSVYSEANTLDDGSGNTTISGLLTAQNNFTVNSNYDTSTALSSATLEVLSLYNMLTNAYEPNERRWSLAYQTNETGSNAGCNLAITSYADNGAYNNIPMVFTRSSGDIIMNYSLTVEGASALHAVTATTLTTSALLKSTLGLTITGANSSFTSGTFSTTLGVTGLSTLNSLSVTTNGVVVNGFTYTYPNITDTLTTLTATQTLTNKTLTSPNINTGVLVGGTINNMTIGATTQSTGKFSTMSANYLNTVSLAGIYCETNFYPLVAGTYNLGEVGGQWFDIFGNNLYIDTLTGFTTSTLISSSASIDPATTLTYNLGTTTNYWNNLYIGTIFSSKLNVTGLATLNSLSVTTNGIIVNGYTYTTPNITDTITTLTASQILTNKTLTSPNINTGILVGGTIDNMPIGNTTISSGNFTTGTFSSTLGVTGISTLHATTVTTLSTSNNTLDDGSGNLVIAGTQYINGGSLFIQPNSSSTNGILKFTSAGNSNYIESGLTSTSNSVAPLLITGFNGGPTFATFTSTSLTLPVELIIGTTSNVPLLYFSSQNSALTHVIDLTNLGVASPWIDSFGAFHYPNAITTNNWHVIDNNGNSVIEVFVDGTEAISMIGTLTTGGLITGVNGVSSQNNFMSYCPFSTTSGIASGSDMIQLITNPSQSYDPNAIRWAIGLGNNETEVGNIGSDLYIYRYGGTAGTFLGASLILDRSTGAMSSTNNTLDNGSGGMAITGGCTINQDGSTPLIVNNSIPEALESAITFQTNTSAKMEVGWSASAGCFIYDNLNGNNILEQGGVTSGYLKTLNNVLDNGSGLMTINGGSTYIDPLIVNTTLTQSAMSFSISGSVQSQFGYNTAGTFMYDNNSSGYMIQGSSTAMTFGKYNSYCSLDSSSGGDILAVENSSGAFAIYAGGSFGGLVGMNIQNSNSSGFSILTLGNDINADRFVIFTNGSARTADGGDGNTTIRTDSGQLIINSAVSPISIEQSTLISGGNFQVKNGSNNALLVNQSTYAVSTANNYLDDGVGNMVVSAGLYIYGDGGPGVAGIAFTGSNTYSGHNTLIGQIKIYIGANTYYIPFYS